jgi:mannose-6-phosphate isomerase-like protein (cupin superfamily)
VRYLIQSSEAASDGVFTPLFDSASGCDTFEQRLLRFGGGLSDEQDPAAADEILYVVGGQGELVVGDERHRLGPGVGAFMPAGTPWRVANDGPEPVVILSVLVREPELRGGRRAAVVDVARQSLAGATAARRFRLGATPDVGCDSATQFLGYIPPGRAPDHYHHYDEVIYIVGGQGVLHIDGEESEPIRAGSCVHLPARLIHCLENTGGDDMTVLGVFRPAGSPAEAYYPDGTLATAAEH